MDNDRIDRLEKPLGEQQEILKQTQPNRVQAKGQRVTLRRFPMLRTFLIISLVALISSLCLRPAPARADTPLLTNGLIKHTFQAVGLGKLLGDLLDLPVDIFSEDFDGRVVHDPQFFNVFWADDWNAANPPDFSTGNIDNFVTRLGASHYFDGAHQYGVNHASLRGSHVASAGLCGGSPGATENFVTILYFITCEVQLPGTHVPSPDDNSIYNVWLPQSTSISNAGTNCSDFGAYHFMSAAATIDWEFGVVPVPTIQSYAFTVLPATCARDKTTMVLSFDKLTALGSHEMIEAATDPIFGTGWIDASTFDLGALDHIAKAGEAADICEKGTGAAGTDAVRLPGGLMVDPYWSNNPATCFPTTHKLSLDETGLPDGVAHSATVSSDGIFADSGPHTVTLPYTTQVVDGSNVSFSYPSPVSGSQAGVRYVTSDSGQTITMNGDVSDTATYSQEDYLTVNTNSGPPAPPSLTSSGWKAHGSTVSLNTDSFLNTPPDRWRFDRWTGGVSALTPATSIVMNGPQTATANYVLQHQVTFDQFGIPPGFAWTVTVDGVAQPGPFSPWLDDGSSHSFSYQTPVLGAAGTRYVLTGTSEPTPLNASSTRTVTGTYKTQYGLTVNTTGLPAPNLATITNGSSTLGSANDSTPLSVWLDRGTVLSLGSDPNVNGAGGIQYFSQGYQNAAPATLLAPFVTTVKYETISQIIQDLLANGGLSGPGASGEANAFNQQWNAVQADMKASRYAQALADLSSFFSHTQAQSGKKLSVAAANIFLLDGSLVYHNALCLARSSGQITAAQASSYYTYYKGIVTSGGGTPLGPC